MIMNSKGKEFETKQEGLDDTTRKYSRTNTSASNANTSTPTSSRQWAAGFRNPRIVRVSRSFGGKDRHSKVCTVRGLRDRRIRLSVPTAIQLYDLQDRLGLGQPSKVVDWLLDATKSDIDKLPPLQIPPGSFPPFHHHQFSSSSSSLISLQQPPHFFNNNNININNAANDPTFLNNNNPTLPMPYINPFYHWEPSSNLSLSHQLGGSTSHNSNMIIPIQQTTDHHHQQLYFPAGAIPASSSSSYMPLPAGVVEMNDQARQFQFLSSSSSSSSQPSSSLMMPATLHLISSSSPMMKSLRLNVNNPEIFRSQENNNSNIHNHPHHRGGGAAGS